MSFEGASPVPGAADTGSVSERSAQGGVIATPRTPRQWTETDIVDWPKDHPDVKDRRGTTWRWHSERDFYITDWNEAASWMQLCKNLGPLLEVLPETPEPPLAHVSMLNVGGDRPCDCSIGRDHVGPRSGVPASQSVPAVAASSTGGKETGEAAETATETLSPDVPEMRVGMVDGTWVVAMADGTGGWVAAGTWDDLTNDDVTDWTEIGPAVDADELHEELYNRAVTAENELARLSLPDSETERPRRCTALTPESDLITEGRQCQQYEGHAHDHTWYGDNGRAYSAWRVTS